MGVAGAGAGEGRRPPGVRPPPSAPRLSPSACAPGSWPTVRSRLALPLHGVRGQRRRGPGGDRLPGLRSERHRDPARGGPAARPRTGRLGRERRSRRHARWWERWTNRRRSCTLCSTATARSAVRVRRAARRRGRSTGGGRASSTGEGATVVVVEDEAAACARGARPGPGSAPGAAPSIPPPRACPGAAGTSRWPAGCSACSIAPAWPPATSTSSSPAPPARWPAIASKRRCLHAAWGTAPLPPRRRSQGRHRRIRGRAPGRRHPRRRRRRVRAHPRLRGLRSRSSRMTPHAGGPLPAPRDGARHQPRRRRRRGLAGPGAPVSAHRRRDPGPAGGASVGEVVRRTRERPARRARRRRRVVATAPADAARAAGAEVVAPPIEPRQGRGPGDRIPHPVRPRLRRRGDRRRGRPASARGDPRRS